MSIYALAVDLKIAGWTEKAIRDELRGSILAHGDSPTCSAVDEAISFANKATPPDPQKAPPSSGR